VRKRNELDESFIKLALEAKFGCANESEKIKKEV